jgi:hypothetical protein
LSLFSRFFFPLAQAKKKVNCETTDAYALVTGLIAFMIFKVYREVKLISAYQILSDNGANDNHDVLHPYG